MSVPQITFPSMLDGTNGFDATEPSAWAIYQQDFPRCGKLPVIEDEEIKVRRTPHPANLSREHTYWHMVTEGDKRDRADESLRRPNLERLIRVPWARPLLINYQHADVKRWKESQYGLVSIYLWHPKVNYLVVLRKRPEGTVLATTYRPSPRNITTYHTKWAEAKKARLTF